MILKMSKTGQFIVPEIKTYKAKRIQHHQTSFKTNAKGTCLGRKHQRRKKPTIKN